MVLPFITCFWGFLSPLPCQEHVFYDIFISEMRLNCARDSSLRSIDVIAKVQRVSFASLYLFWQRLSWACFNLQYTCSLVTYLKVLSRPSYWSSITVLFFLLWVLGVVDSQFLLSNFVATSLLIKLLHKNLFSTFYQQLLLIKDDLSVVSSKIGS